MSVGSGPSSLESLAYYDPDTSSWRTFQACLLSMTGVPSEKFSGTFPRSGMTRSGMLFRRSRSVPHTFVTGSSLLPTPRAEKTTEENPETWLKRHERGDVATPPLALAVRMLPTPTATPYGSNQGGGSTGREGKPKRPSLAQLVKGKLFPTPTAADAKRGPDLTRKNREGSGGDDLTTRVARELWPTPTVTGNNNKSEYGPKAGDGLAHAVRKSLWPTPTSRDWKDTPGMATEGPDGRNRVDMLARAVHNPHLRFPTPRGSEGGVGMYGGTGSRQMLESLETQGHISSEEKRSMEAGGGGRLNPDWVEWLMGLPIGWTALEPLETPSYPPSHSGLEGGS